MKRPSIDEYYIEMAKVVSTRSTCLKKKYGSVIVKNNRVLSTGYNNPPSKEPHCAVCTKCSGNGDMEEYGRCPALHSEMNAVLTPSRDEMIGADLYLAGYDVKTGEAIECEAWPCEICLRLIKNAGINRIINNKGVIYLRSDDGILRQIIDKKETK